MAKFILTNVSETDQPFTGINIPAGKSRRVEMPDVWDLTWRTLAGLVPTTFLIRPLTTDFNSLRLVSRLVLDEVASVSAGTPTPGVPSGVTTLSALTTILTVADVGKFFIGNLTSNNVGVQLPAISDMIAAGVSGWIWLQAAGTDGGVRNLIPYPVSGEKLQGIIDYAISIAARQGVALYCDVVGGSWYYLGYA